MRKALMTVALVAVASLALWGYLRHRAHVREVALERLGDAPAPVVQRSSPIKVKELVERYENGTKKAVHHVFESDPHMREGVSSEYYRNGKLKSETTYVANEATGRFAFYSEDGALALEGTLKNGLRDGRFTEWHPDGRVKIECGYKNGLLDGAWTEYYDADGSPKKLEAHYREGSLIGRYALYKLDGLIKEEHFYGQIPPQEGSDVNFAPQPQPTARDCSDTPFSGDAQRK